MRQCVLEGEKVTTIGGWNWRIIWCRPVLADGEGARLLRRSGGVDPELPQQPRDVNSWGTDGYSNLTTL